MTRRMVRGACALVVGALALTCSVAVPPASADGPSGFAVGGWVPIPLHVGDTLGVGVDGSGAILAAYVAPGPTIEVRRFLADGRLDPAYGTAGVVSAFASDSSLWQPPVIAADGSVYLSDSSGDQARTRRITPAGAVDGTYGTDAQLLGAYLGPDGTARRARVVSGTWILERFDAHGQLDTSFAGDGAAELPGCDLPATGGYAVGVPFADGSTLVECPGDGMTAIHRLDPAGHETGSRSPSPFTSSFQQLADGTFVSSATEGMDTVVTRWTTALAPDASFGDAGRVVIPGLLQRTVISGDRALVVTSGPGVWSSRRTIRVTAVDAGGIDPTFGTDGTTAVQALWPDPSVIGMSAFDAGPDGEGGIALTTRTVSGSAWDSRLRQIDASGRVRSEVRIAPTEGTPILTRDGAVILRSHQPAAIGSGVNALRRFGFDDIAVAPFGSATAFAKRLSLDVRGRAATAAEVTAFTGAIADGVPAATLVRQALAEPAWTSKLEPSVRLYWAYFLRPPDPTGLRYWMAKRANGLTVARMSAVFADSGEFKNTYGSLSNRQFVAFVYRSVMARDGDAAGIAYWTGRLDRRVTSRGQLMATFSESTEHVRRRAEQVAVVSPFMATLGRTPTGSELADWTSPTRLGDTDALVRDLIASDAYRTRVS